MKWMIVDFSIEERMAIETRARSVLAHDSHDDVARLCSTLIRQNAYQERLLAQATGHIAELESTQWRATAKRRPWWRIVA